MVGTTMRSAITPHLPHLLLTSMLREEGGTVRSSVLVNTNICSYRLREVRHAVTEGIMAGSLLPLL